MSSAGANSDVICAVLTASTAMPFLFFAGAGIWFFSGEHKGSTNLLSALLFLSLVAVIYSIWNGYSIGLWPAVGVAMQSVTVFLFGWSIGTASRRNLGLAFADSPSPKLVTEGPYSLVRHPLYTAYIIYWVGGLAVATSIFTLLSTVVMIVVYIYAARTEDKVLANRFKEDFPKWRETTGAFFPKWR